MEEEKIAYKFQVGDIMDKCLRHLKFLSETLATLYHATLRYESDTIPNLQTDSLPFTISDLHGKREFPVVKSDTLGWLFEKGLEEMIVGLTESTIEAYSFAQIIRLSKETHEFNVHTLKEVEQLLFNKISAISNKAKKMPFPVLITQIESDIQRPLPFRKEIVSMNAVRNCLVHRNGLVSSLDIKDDPTEKLQLFYIDLVTLYEKDEQMIVSSWKNKVNGLNTKKIMLTPIAKTVSYSLDERIRLDQNICNGLIFTCVQFVQHLFEAVVPALNNKA